MGEEETKKPEGETKKPEEQPPKEEEKKESVPFDIDGLRKEIEMDEKKKNEAINNRINELKDKSLTAEQIKDVMKNMIKTSDESIAKMKEEYEKKISDLSTKFESVETGSKVKTQIEEKPFVAPDGTKSATEVTSENYDEYALEHYGLIRKKQ